MNEAHLQLLRRGFKRHQRHRLIASLAIVLALLFAAVFALAGVDLLLGAY